MPALFGMHVTSTMIIRRVNICAITFICLKLNDQQSVFDWDISCLVMVYFFPACLFSFCEVPFTCCCVGSMLVFNPVYYICTCTYMHMYIYHNKYSTTNSFIPREGFGPGS